MKKGTIDDVRNPHIRLLCESLQKLPEYLEERRKKIEARREFCRYVFEKACRDSGLLNRNLK
jgi:hypothetical protein